MERSDFRIVFMGTPNFAVPSLKLLHQSAYDIAAVVTAPDRPAGRGLKLRQSPVKEYALEHHLPVLQPEKLKEDAFLSSLIQFAPQLLVVVAFRMLPKMVWQVPEYGTINLHASLLPQYRGAAPIHWAVMNGEETTGLTTFFINEDIDTGDVLLQETVPIGKEMDSGELHDVMQEKGAALLLKTVDEIRQGSIHPQAQQDLTPFLSLKAAPKLTRQHCQIDWNRPARDIYNMIRGLRPYPGAYTHLVLANGKQLEMKIWEASPEFNVALGKPGSLSVQNELMLVSCRDASLRLQLIQPAGRQKMEASAFLRGTSIPDQCL